MKFGTDGTTAGFCTEEQLENLHSLLLKIGDEVKQETPIIVVKKFNDKLYFLAVDDGIPHKCTLCDVVKNQFVEIINENNLQRPKLALMCKDCMELMWNTLCNVIDKK